ncbi:mechanosensitive ion channel family protein [Leifsonia aquatica]|uniref:Transporter, small conductance mechanosensitive ion channel MscS family protein n=2 Tax=Leifsonia aquatica TaxID=144185 RepID=U2RQ88_LEIAQ|nr:mechanosensitive ion channel domain-containing protein [Leifsonia aquatica]ERK70754.1 transporter, small conductance mechanosensitive ion channel MscS family protein [Leifsonia aquatica ATCC 14665]MBB2965788.1 small-conductance mechanosensitive channel [Leifsonia aquatica]
MSALRTWPGLAVACVVAVVLAIVVTAIVGAVLRAVARRRTWPELLIRNARVPFRLFLLVVVLWIAVTISLPPEVPGGWQQGIHHTMLILAIVTGVWFAAAMVVFVEDLGLARYRLDVPDNRYARKVRTQVLILRRLTVVAAVVIGLGAVLLTFPALQAAGASLLASAGVIGIIAGVAAQSSLANLFAGIQLAFSDAIRLDDVVVVEQQWGTIEEITLTYVVVHVWDDRRLVLPSTYFTTKPFENWTRQHSELLGSVEFDLDWRVSPGGMRSELNRILATTNLWDGRTGVLQVTDAVAGWVRVRVLVTAKDAPTLFDLRCLVRERLIDWMQRYAPASLPRSRVELVEPPAPSVPTARAQAQTNDDARLFGGSPEKEQRGAQFTEAIPVIQPGVDGDEEQARP